MAKAKAETTLDTTDVLEWAQAELEKSTEPRRTHLSNIVASLERLLVAENQAFRKELRVKGVK